MQILGGAPKSRFIREIGGVDDESVPFPAAYRVPQPLTYGGRRMSAVDADDANIMHHLDKNHYGLRSLHYLVVVVVEHWKHGRSGGRAKADKTPLGKRPVLHAVI